MTYHISVTGESRSFPAEHALYEMASDQGDALVVVGDNACVDVDPSAHSVVIIELGDACLEALVGDYVDAGNIVGFARWRLGASAPSDLVELVRLPSTADAAVEAARLIFEALGLQVSVCADRIGRIVDRLIRPQFNLALNAVDDGLATGENLDECLILGLGYRKGVYAPLVASGLEHHYEVCKALFETYGQAQFAPARAAVAAAQKAACND